MLYIHHSTGIGGAPISLIEMIKALPAEEFDAEVLLLKKSEVCDLLDAERIKYSVARSLFYEQWYLPYAHINIGWAPISSPLKFLYLSLVWIISRYFASRRLLQNYDADIIHLNSYALTDFLCASSKKAKTVIHIREPATEGHFGIRKRMNVHQIVRYADEVIAISQDNLKRLKLNGFGQVVYNSFSPSLQNHRSPSSLELSVIYLGGASIHKGFIALADVAPMVNPSIKIKILLYVHDSSLERKWPRIFKRRLKRVLSSDFRNIELSIAKLKALENVEIIGIVKDTEPYVESSRVLLNLFSISHFSRPIIESYASGRPVIATNIDGIEESVIDGLTGFLVPKDGSQALAETINRVVPDDALLDALGANARRFAECRFSSKNVEKVVEIYHKLMIVNHSY